MRASYSPNEEIPPQTSTPKPSSRHRHNDPKTAPSRTTDLAKTLTPNNGGDASTHYPRSPMTQRSPATRDLKASGEPEPAPPPGPQRLAERPVDLKDAADYSESESSVASTEESSAAEEDIVTQSSLPFRSNLDAYDGHGDTGRRSSSDTDKAGGAERQLIQYRERLARDIARREMSSRSSQTAGTGRSRVSPIQEETTVASPPDTSSSEPTTASTESGHTIRGGTTPGLTARTPSYPFPRMMSSSFAAHQGLHHPFTSLSPTTFPPNLQQTHPTSFEGLRIQEKVLSNPSTPASNMTFLPAGYARSDDGPHDFPSPNLYDLSLILSAEPGLEAWWNAVVQIMTEAYKAERVTLAVPADSTDVENVPWGQKATYNVHWEDEMSMGYMARGSSLVPSSTATEEPVLETPTPAEDLLRPSRPGIQSRHSFTAYEDKKERGAGADRLAAPSRPAPLSRSVTSHPAPSLPRDGGYDFGSHLNKQALEEHDAMDGQQELPSWETPFGGQRKGRGKMLNVLQALDYEADPLIDHNGVMRVLERGKVIALTRNYPYLDPTGTENITPSDSKARKPSPEGSKKKIVRRTRTSSTSKASSAIGGAKSASLSSSRTARHPGLERRKTTGMSARMDDDLPRPATPNYEEFEQAPPSPWSQSPAPSPAVRQEVSENPFFTDAMVDEETFNPSPAPPDYISIRPPEAIGFDNSWTVLHIPLIHPLLSKPNPAFKLDSTLMDQKSSARARAGRADVASEAPSLSPEAPPKQKHVPIAIISILSPIIPYPSNLRYSLEHLAPHLATSFSMCRHYTNLEIEVNGLQKRRPQNAGFGAIGHDGRPLVDPTAFANMGYLPTEDARGSVAGSITSPSDYSGVSRSGGASGGGTPMWEPSAVGFAVDPRPSASSPAPVGDSYFNTKPKSGTVGTGSRRNSKESSTADKRSSLRLSSGKSQPAEAVIVSPSLLDTTTAIDVAGRSSDELSAASIKSVKSPLRQGSVKEVREQQAPGGQQAGLAAPSGKHSAPTTPGTHRHTQLHSYGADFASTFQSLPPSSIIPGKGAQQPQAPTRMSSISTVQTEMTPPSDRLKGLILDSLPAHVFVALPQTGEIVWVNSRFLTYRGKTSADLASDPWGSLHPDDRDDYLRAWAHSVRTGEQFSRTVRIRRFDGQYRWFYARAVASKDKRGVILQFLGSYMDIHDQHIAELRAARQEEIEASEAKHRLLANLIPQIIFTATEDEGITFANEQWLSYTGQSFEDSLGLGFMDHVHPDDLAKCHVPTDKPPTPRPRDDSKRHKYTTSTGKPNASLFGQPPPSSPDANLRGVHVALSRHNSSSSSSVYELPTANLTELARKGVIKVATDSNGRLSYTTEIRLRSKFGDYRWHLVRCVEIDNIDFGNGASSYFGSATDINDHKLLEAKLKEAMDSKGRFLSNMSHEIRTPLIGISGMVSFLQDTTLNEEQRDYTNTIQTSANSLLMIINDILDLSKVDAGMMKLNHEWFHTRSLIEDVNELVSTMAIAKRLELNYVVEEDVPAWVKGDKVRIRQVLLNVIGNAIKFTNQGEVFSRCKVVDREGLNLNDNEIMLEFSIIDTGRGFTKEEAELIFKPFSQIDGSSTRQHGGSGLGLVISRQLVELHGGKMEGTAIPGKGSTFTFTAKFGLPTTADGPEAQTSPRLPDAPKQTPLQEQLAHASMQQSMANRILQGTPTESPQTDTSFASPPLGSSGSSQPSVSSTRTHLTGRSSMSSVNVGLVCFSEAARASGQDLSQMKLDITMGKNSPGLTPTPNNEPASGAVGEYRPPMYSILVISPQTHSREATTRHIEMTLPKEVAHQITALASVEDAQKLIGGEDPVIFTHIVVNLPSPEEIISLMDQIRKSGMVGKTRILILSDSVQRQAVLKQVAGTEYEELLSEKAVTYIYKPVKPSRFAVIFDPAKERDLSIDRNRSTAQKIVESQKQSYLEAEKRMGHKGYKVLLVEDNPVNQKVLQKYLKKVGVEVEVATDGVECTENVFSHPHNYYSLILCDLHMPRKDGYQACREIRAWEKSMHFDPMPIIALSANVMSDVQEKCVAAGFNDYVTKPVDFIELSTALSKFF